jgi:hypothetical protein
MVFKKKKKTSILFIHKMRLLTHVFLFFSQKTDCDGLTLVSLQPVGSRTSFIPNRQQNMLKTKQQATRIMKNNNNNNLDTKC